MKFVDELRQKPEKERKIILWTILIILALILGSLWIYISYKSIKDFKPPEINFPQ